MTVRASQYRLVECCPFQLSRRERGFDSRWDHQAKSSLFRSSRSVLGAFDTGRVCPQAAGQVIRTARDFGSSASAEKSGPDRRSPRDARRNLQLVHRGLRHRRPEGRKSAARGIEQFTVSTPRFTEERPQISHYDCEAHGKPAQQEIETNKFTGGANRPFRRHEDGH